MKKIFKCKFEAEVISNLVWSVLAQIEFDRQNFYISIP